MESGPILESDSLKDWLRLRLRLGLSLEKPHDIVELLSMIMQGLTFLFDFLVEDARRCKLSSGANELLLTAVEPGSCLMAGVS